MGMKLLSVAQVAKLKGVTRFTVHRWIKGDLPAVKVGNQLVIEQVDLDAFTPRPAGNPSFKGKGKALATKAQGKGAAVVKAPVKQVPKPVEAPAVPAAPLPRIKYSTEPTTPPGAGYERIRRSSCGRFEWVDRPIQR